MRVPIISPSKNKNSAWETCITMALRGGIGILRAIDFRKAIEQCKAVSKVKRYKHGFIPQCIGTENVILELLNNKHKDDFRVALVTENGKIGGKLLGML